MNDNFSQKVMGAIKKDDLKQRPSLFFRAKYGVFWVSSLGVVLLGSFATAIIIFLFFDYDLSAKLSATQSSANVFLVAIPVLWLFAMVLLSGLGVFSFKNTKFGYRYQSIKIVTTIFILSVFFGILLNIFDVGQYFNSHLNKYIQYSQIEESEDILD